MIELALVGVGAGNPEQLTLQAIRALNAADVVLLPRKGGERGELASIREAICDEVLASPKPRRARFDLPERDAGAADYGAGVADWHAAVGAAWSAALAGALPRGGRAALMIWGDPSLYDSSLRIAERVARELPLTVRVIPGLTSVQALCAAHAIPLNAVGAPVLITTGRRLREEGWPGAADTLVVMLDGDCAFETVPPKGVSIWWGAYLGMTGEITLAGPLAETGPRIRAARAAARAERGWIMDVYILRRGNDLISVHAWTGGRFAPLRSD